MASLILIGGSLGDQYGRRRIFVIGVVWFACASLLCGIAMNAETLIAARILQGIGAALLTPGSLSMIQGAIRPRDRAKAIGSWSGFGGIAIAIGPFVGGWLIEFASWRWIFLLNLPLAVVTLGVSKRFVPETSNPDAFRGFDVTGAVLASARTRWRDLRPDPVRQHGQALAAGVVGVLALHRLRDRRGADARTR